MDETVGDPHIRAAFASVEHQASEQLYAPFPMTQFTAQCCSEAFIHLRSAGHIGKVNSRCHSVAAR